MNCSPIALRMGLPRFGQSSKDLRTTRRSTSLWEPALPRAVAAEEDDLLRVKFLGDQLGNGLNCFPVDGDFGHLMETSLRMFCCEFA